MFRQTCEFHANSMHEKETKKQEYKYRMKKTHDIRAKCTRFHAIFMLLRCEIDFNRFSCVKSNSLIYHSSCDYSMNFSINFILFQWSTMHWTFFCLKSTYSSKYRRINSVELKNDTLLRMHQSQIQSSMWSYHLINVNNIISPSKQVWSLICINLNSLYPRSFMPSLVENGPVVLDF